MPACIALRKGARRQPSENTINYGCVTKAHQLSSGLANTILKKKKSIPMILCLFWSCWHQLSLPLRSLQTCQSRAQRGGINPNSTWQWSDVMKQQHVQRKCLALTGDPAGTGNRQQEAISSISETQLPRLAGLPRIRSVDGWSNLYRN